MTDREKIAEDVADKMNYMGSCLNEKNIILGIITGKRETTDSLCSTCESESCISNGTAISKADYNERLKADIIITLDKIRTEIEEYKSRRLIWAIGAENLEKGKQIALEYVLAILDKYKEESEE